VASRLLPDRFLDGRLAHQSGWRPCAVADTTGPTARVRCAPPSPFDRRALADVVASAHEAAQEAAHDTSRVDAFVRARHLSALVDLRSDAESPLAIDRAVASLEQAVRRTPHDAALLNDLAVAHLARAERDQQLVPLLRALDAVERARTRDGASEPVLFNRALILERLHLVSRARRAWADYAAIERLPAWQREARAHLRALDAIVDAGSRTMPTADALLATAGADTKLDTLVRRTPQWARETGFALLGAWGLAVGQGDTARARAALGLARDAAHALGTIGGDGSLARAVAAIDAAGPARTPLLARAHADYTSGYALYGRGAYDEAARTLARAERGLHAGGSPAAAWAAHYRAVALISRGDYADAERMLRGIAATATDAEPAVRGKAIWTLGLATGRQGAYEAANRRYREATTYFAATRETENLGMLASLLAEGLDLAGQSAAARAEGLKALRLLAPYRRSGFLGGHLGIVASFARADSLHHAALDVVDEVFDLNAGQDRPQFVAWVHGERARSLIATDRPDSARAELAEALRWSDRIAPGAGRERFRARILLAHAQLLRATDPRAAYDELRRVVDAYRATNSEIELPNALYQAAVAARAAGDGAGARRCLEEAVARIEARRAWFPTAEVRATFYESAEGVFDALMQLELDAGHADVAFDYLERARAAAWDAPAGRSTDRRPAAGPPRLADLQRRVPPNGLAVAYAVLPDRLVVWTIAARGWSHRTLPVGRDSVAALVARFDVDAGEPAVDVHAARARLYDLLIRPVAREIGGVTAVTIVPDRELSRLPYVALWNRETRRYLIEDVSVRTLPSAALLVAPAAAVPSSRLTSALVVGDPAFDRVALAQVARLPGAAREAARVAALYPGARLLTGDEARRDTLLGLLPRQRIFHFAGHAFADAEQPERSYLALAADRGDDGILRARDIGALRLSHVRMVILSACSTLGARATHVGAIAGLAYSFLRAGAPAIVSSLWDVNDETTTPVLVAFHRRFVQGEPAVDALRGAQLDALRSPDPALRAPRAWGAFIYTGP